MNNGAVLEASKRSLWISELITYRFLTEEPEGLPYLQILFVVALLIVGFIFYKNREIFRISAKKHYTLTVSAEPKQIPADGKSVSTIYVELHDNEGTTIEADYDSITSISATHGKIISEKPKTGKESVPLLDHLLLTFNKLLKFSEKSKIDTYISKGESRLTVKLVSTPQVGEVNISAYIPRKGRAKTSVAFTEKRRYCMHCGAQTSLDAIRCHRCGKTPPSGVDVKSCPNCGEGIPQLAIFCGECGSRQT